MRTDKLTKVLLGIIAIALWTIALSPWLRPAPVAAQEKVSFESFECTGELKPKPWGATDPILGGYSVKLKCE